MKPTALMKAMGRLAGTGLLMACVFGACGGDDPETSGKYEMYLYEEGPTVIEITFLKGRCCGRVTMGAKSPEAKTEIIRVAEALADTIPIDGSRPSTDDELIGFVPQPGSADMSDWNEDLESDPTQGPRVISIKTGETAFDWGNGGTGPFDEYGFKAVAIETYVHLVQGWKLAMDLVYMSSPEGADGAFHYRNPDYPDEPYWDLGTQIH